MGLMDQIGYSSHFQSLFIVVVERNLYAKKNPKDNGRRSLILINSSSLRGVNIFALLPRRYSFVVVVVVCET
ncbi:CLUMA_CG016715, isoform A [Clunio marinus]|uniref:CLUMA_CG016715, isoform A n=1 Tax=Clunio marinus TaxID=568069 RepID=A0A1J1IY58_9DIPT|nr:CLUMA_CG016715, isoform A [Clunio marinus]